MRKIDWNEVQEAQEFKKMPAGAYVCGITKVEDDEKRGFVRFEFDIADGEFKNYYRLLNESKGFWGGSFIKSYKEKALPFFKAFYLAVEKSNSGYFFNEENLQDLKRKYIGLILGDEEYITNAGEVKSRLYVHSVLSVSDVRNGKFEVPAAKYLTADKPSVKPASKANVNVDFEEVEIIDDDDLPF